MQQEETGRQAGFALALGNFDGLHRGHALVLQKAKQCALEAGLTPGVLLFDEHPKQVLVGEAPPLLMTGEEKRALLEEAGFTVLTLSFRQTKDLSPRAFVQLLATVYRARVLCCGANYRFGRDAVGTADTLRALCPDYALTLHVVPDEVYRGALISSTRIRQAVEQGRIEDANAMLLRPFSYRLPVAAGDKRGRTLGFPTINQYFLPAMIRPCAGVYASKVVLNGVCYPAVTNIGVRPTIGTGVFHSETHILGFSGDLYGRQVEVTLLQYLRAERKFENLDALRAAMAADTAAAKEVLNAYEQAAEAADKSSLL